MKLKLIRPLAFIDLEATGTDREKDRIVEISIVKMMPDGELVTRTRKVNPTIPIPEGATAVHGISDDDVKDCPEFKSLAKGILEIITDCDLAGYNSNAFDFPMLYAEFRRAGINWDFKAHFMVDVGNLFKIKEERTLTAAVKFYCGEALDGAHGAEVDTLATVKVLQAQMERYEDLPETVGELAIVSNYNRPMLDLSGKFSCNEAGDIIINFGKYRGEPAKAHLDFIDWMYYRADFAPDTNAICEALLGISSGLFNG